MSRIASGHLALCQGGSVRARESRKISEEEGRQGCGGGTPAFEMILPQAAGWAGFGADYL